MKYLITLLMFFTFSCVEEPRTPVLDASIDAGVFMDGGDCQPRVPLDTVQHCGSCNNVCDLRTSDSCEAGSCVCGSHTACVGLEVCHNSRCIIPDTSGMACEFDDWCDPGHQCVDSHCTYIGCVPEECNGYDDDCDGVIDNIGRGPLAEYCYSGPEGPYGDIDLPCKRGVRTCHDGIWSACVGEIPPTPESGLLACDFVDNNCDGCVDSENISGICVPPAQAPMDVLFLIDSSGSMSSHTAVVKQAVQLFSTRLASDTTTRWGIVSVPGQLVDGVNEVTLDLSPFEDFLPALLLFDASSFGTEPTYDAVQDVAINGLPISWREGSIRIIIVFTDEEAQTVRGLTQTDMCDSLTHGEVLVVVTEIRFLEDWDECTTHLLSLPSAAWGTGESCSSTSDCAVGNSCIENICVSAEAENTANDLNGVITDPC